MTEFLLTEGFLGGKSVSIDEMRYRSIVSSKAVISAIWDAEDSFTLLANSFIEFEDYLLRASLELFFQREMQKNIDNYFDDVRQHGNLKFVSFLTASRMYEEQLHRRTSKLKKLTDEEIEMKSVFVEAYDESLEYRVVYALRNHSLHNELPLRSITFSTNIQSSSGKLKDGSPERHRVIVIPKIATKDFCASDKIKQVTRNEVLALGVKNLDVRFFARVYLSYIAKCHEVFREKTGKILENALEYLKAATEELSEIKGSEARHIGVVQVENDKVVEEHDIDYKTRLRILELRKFWTGLKWNHMGFVSSEIVQSKDTYPSDHSKLWIPK